MTKEQLEKKVKSLERTIKRKNAAHKKDFDKFKEGLQGTYEEMSDNYYKKANEVNALEAKLKISDKIIETINKLADKL